MPRYRKVSKQQRGRRWYLVYRPPGRAKQVWEPVGVDEVEAERRRLMKQAELADPEYIQPSTDSFKALCDEWWEVVASVAGRYAESTRKDYRSVLDHHVIPRLGGLPMSKVRYRTLQKMVSDMRAESIGPKRINNVLIVISQVFEYGVNAELCRDNPVDKVKRLAVVRDEVDCLSAKELWGLFSAVEEIDPFYAPLVITACRTGMRLGELRALTWTCVDFERRVIRVRASKSRSEIKTPKTDAGWRTIPMDEVVTEQLRKKYQAHGEICEIVFPSKTLTHFDPNNIRKRVLHKALDHAGLRRVTWHSLRHSAASMLAASRGADTEVQGILGHSSIKVTKDLYAHLFEEQKRDAIDRMSAYLEANRPDGVKEEAVDYRGARPYGQANAA